MAEDYPSTAADMADAGTPIPPIDNIHKPDPDLFLPILQEAPPPPMQMENQLDTQMPEAFPALTPQNPIIPPNIASQQRTSTPARQVNGNAESAPPMPSKAASHGAPARRYLNEKVTGVLLEGMKRLAADQPEDPLRVLGEFLLQRSRELEGTT